MDIVIEQVPDEPTQDATDAPPPQPQLQRETTGAISEAIPEEAPKRRGRPPGSKNKPKIIEQVPSEEPIPTQAIEHPPPPDPIVLNEPPYEEPRKKKPAAPRKPRAPKAQAPAPPSTPQAPIPQTPVQVAASMLEILRLEQADRKHRRGQMYKSWVK